MSKILELVAFYPDENAGKMMYVHTRNKCYIKNGLDITVLNFDAKEDYILENVNVITLDTYINNPDSYDLLIIHAANLRNHYKFLKKHIDKFKKVIFFYHGHEILKINKVYSRPYDFVKGKNPLEKLLQNVYDSFKLFIWRKYLPKIAYKSHFIFVSNWMKEEFFKATRIDPKVIEGRESIIYNSIDSSFEYEKYNENCNKEYDFITIRGSLDNSKYAVDIVNRLAFNTPDKKFLLIGRGDFFKFNKKAPNLTLEERFLKHEEILNKLNTAYYALMPTRTDAQGLMMCEMAGFGIPIITSDIPVCHEVFGDFPNAYYIDNEDTELSLSKFSRVMSHCYKHERYYKKNTVYKEVELIYSLMNNE